MNEDAHKVHEHEKSFSIKHKNRRTKLSNES